MRRRQFTLSYYFPVDPGFYSGEPLLLCRDLMATSIVSGPLMPKTNRLVGCTSTADVMLLP